MSSPDEERVTQKFNLRHIIESQTAEITPHLAIDEINDNFLDAPHPKEEICTDITITIDIKNRKIIFDARGTKGMDMAEMNNFATWGNPHNDPKQIREHGLGGKLACLYLIDQNSSQVQITSQAPGSNQMLRLEINNWWQNLNDNQEFPVVKIPSGEYPEGMTRIELSGVRPERLSGNIARIADELGLTYGPLIIQKIMNLKINLLEPKQVRKIFIPALIPTFSKDLFNQQLNVPITDKSDTRANISWGLIDQNYRTHEQTERRKYLEQSSGISYPDPLQIEGNRLYLYYHGRLLSTIPLSQLEIPGYTKRGSIFTFIIVADITSGWAPKNILKSGLNASSSELTGLKNKIIYFTQTDISRLTKDAGPTQEINQQYRSKIHVAQEALNKTLLTVFDGKSDLMISTFHLPQNTVIFQAGSESKPKSPIKFSLPTRSRNPSLTPPNRNLDKNLQVKEVSGEVQNLIQVVPEITPSLNFPDQKIQAELIVENTGKTVILLNLKHPLVNYWLNQKPGPCTAYLLDLTARILFAEKWKNREPHNSTAFEDGLNRDVDNFLLIAASQGLIEK
jgi:hypothetical protein